MKCANCKNPSLFEYRLTHEVSVFYCGKHLPKFLQERKRAQLLVVTEEFQEKKEEAKEVLSPEDEEVETEEEPELEAPKKKAPKKKKAE